MSHRTALPRVPGWPAGLLPWWGATLVAVTATLTGFAFHAGAGHEELGAVFATCYVLGCLAAVLLVRRTGVFAAVIQPPLILFVAVPTSYFLLHGGELSGIKDILINCGYPLIERFPLMFFTSAAVLLIGMARWYLDKQSADAAGHTTTAAVSGLAEKVARRFTRSADPDAAHDDRKDPRPPRRPRRAPQAQSRRSRSGDSSRARHHRPPESDIAASAAAADRRERAAARERYRPRRDDEAYAGGEPRRPRPQRRRDPRDARDPRERREPRRRTPPPDYNRSEYDRSEYERPEYERPRRRRDGYDAGYPGYEPDYERGYRERPEPRRRGPAPDDSHLPYSQVRYRRED